MKTLNSEHLLMREVFHTEYQDTYNQAWARKAQEIKEIGFNRAHARHMRDYPTLRMRIIDGDLTAYYTGTAECEALVLANR